MNDPDADFEEPTATVDDRTGEAVEHLRAAAHEMIGAFRGFLDVAEELVDDPKAGEAVVETVTALADAARRGTRSAMRDAAAGSSGADYERIDLDD
jgi:hypothetical protein